MRNHIRLLGRKDYQQLHGLRSLDYVLMFIPVEPAFLLAIDRQPELISEALQNNIMLVSPTTLLVALRTIANLWRYEHQSRNAQRLPSGRGAFTTKCACLWMICPPSARAWIRRKRAIARR